LSGATLSSLDLQEQIVRIDRAVAEMHKFQSESGKSRAESQKLSRNRFLAPLAAAAAFFGATLAIIGPVVLRSLFGHCP